ncbi:hypothetical protein M3664_27765 [Paenibacillus lautus]|uniref:class I SAM-dependent methyltransferase n=1 Tax=Paenibacillus lautus TaxID=1401 RepID=UPI002040C667|nr:hypothetical protein [Paenibacillus lautus]MCM3261597.1 hypothetical protein [Paenibacillus lautus]
MKKFFELDSSQQVEIILEAIEENKKKRKALINPSQTERNIEDPYMDLYWKNKEVHENSNPIPIPENTRLRFIKRVIGKLIRTYTRKQVHFNYSVSSYMDLTLKHFRKINSSLRNMTSEIDSLQSKNNDLEKRIGVLFEENQKIIHDISVEELQRQVNLLRANESDYSETLTNTREWLSGIEKDKNETESWLKLIDKRLNIIEQFQHRTRKELYAELKHIELEGEKKEKEKYRIVNNEKYQNMINEGNIRINLGCGHLPKSDYLNVDMRQLDGVDIVADVSRLPFENGSIDEIYLSHVIEHFSEQDMEMFILPYWYSLLKNKGTIRIICPNWEAMLEGYAAGNISFEVLKEITFGSQEYEGNQHFNMFSPDSLKELLLKIGFREVNEIHRVRANGLCLEMELEGVR